MARRTTGSGPYWLRARFPGRCSSCGGEVKKNARIFFFPNSRRALCDADECGGQASRDYDAARFDEAQTGAF